MRGVMLSEAKHLHRENRPFASLRVTTIPHSQFYIRLCFYRSFQGDALFSSRVWVGSAPTSSRRNRRASSCKFPGGAAWTTARHLPQSSSAGSQAEGIGGPSTAAVQASAAVTAILQ